MDALFRFVDLVECKLRVLSYSERDIADAFRGARSVLKDNKGRSHRPDVGEQGFYVSGRCRVRQIRDEDCGSNSLQVNLQSRIQHICDAPMSLLFSLLRLAFSLFPLSEVVRHNEEEYEVESV